MGDASVWPLLGRLVISLAVVIALMVACAWALRRSPMRVGTGRRVGGLEVTGRASLGRNTAVALVRAANRAFVVGVSEHGVTLLGEVDPASLELDDSEGEGTRPRGDTRPGTAGMGLMSMLRERTVRRS
jgi:flagellar biosynthetic protein FliO